jgi:hypothetical protein
MANITYPKPTPTRRAGGRSQNQAPRHPTVRFHSLGPGEWGIEGPVGEVQIGVPVDVRTKSGKTQTVVPIALVETGEPAWADCEVGVWQFGRPGRWVPPADDNGQWLVSIDPDMIDDRGVAPVRQHGTVEFIVLSQPPVAGPDEYGCCLYGRAPEGAAD